MAPRMSAQDKLWQTQSDLRTLTEADQIRNDPSRMSAVKKHATDQVKTLAKVAGASKSTKK